MFEKKEKPLRTGLKCAHGTINKELCEEEFVGLDSKTNIEKIFHVIRKKINKMAQLNNMFFAYNKIKIKLPNKQKMKLTIRN